MITLPPAMKRVCLHYDTPRFHTHKCTLYMGRTTEECYDVHLVTWSDIHRSCPRGFYYHIVYYIYVLVSAQTRSRTETDTNSIPERVAMDRVPMVNGNEHMINRCKLNRSDKLIN